MSRSSGRMVVHMKCDICGNDTLKLSKVNHRQRGRLKVCPACLEREKSNLISSVGCGCR